ncbi:MAG: amidase [Alphaproteobacteria bacterium]
MKFPYPSVAKVRELGEQLGMELTDEEASTLRAQMEPLCGAADAMLRMPDYLPQTKYGRDPGYRPEGEENKYNAWARKTAIKGAARGKLKGKSIALKDNVMVAGVPMTNGTSILEGYVPDVDASIVTRILDAGGEIVGIANCEYYCLSGGSHTSNTGPVHNPHKMGHTAGGSSCGSAALVAAGEVDMAIGGDQGGSIRMPGAFCGIYGMKPTHSLVPYTGLCSMEATIDHTGPMTANVADNALLLEVIAGDDGYDGRQKAPKTHNYSKLLDGGVKGMKIAVVKEGFGQEMSEKVVDDKVKAGAKRFEKMGAKVDEISVPMHAEMATYFMPMVMEGMMREAFFGNGIAPGMRNLHAVSMIERSKSWRERSNEMPPNVKLAMLFGTFMIDAFDGLVYAKGQNLKRKATDHFNKLFEEYDLLLMPTVPMTARKMPPADCSVDDYIMEAWCMLSNTPTFDVTGHPSMTIPCGMSKDGLPVGLMLSGRHFEEPTIYKAAAAFEAAGDWTKM